MNQRTYPICRTNCGTAGTRHRIQIACRKAVPILDWAILDWLVPVSEPIASFHPDMRLAGTADRLRDLPILRPC